MQLPTPPIVSCFLEDTYVTKTGQFDAIFEID